MCSARSRSRPIARVELANELVDLRADPHVVARGVQVARVEADPEPRVSVEPVDQRRQLLERAADRAAGAGRVLDQQPRIALAALEDLRQRAARAVEPGSKPGAEMRADVEDDAVGVDRARGIDGRLQRGDRLLVDLVGRSRRGCRGRARGRRRRRSRAPRASRGTPRSPRPSGSSAATSAGSA